MKTAISIPEDVFEQAELAAKRLGVSRSELYVQAIRAFLGPRRDAAITASYDEAFRDRDDPHTARFRKKAARATLLAVEWSKE